MKIVTIDMTNYTVWSITGNGSDYTESYQSDGSVSAQWNITEIRNGVTTTALVSTVFLPSQQEIITVDDTVQVNQGDSALNEPLFDLLLSKVKQRKLYELDQAWQSAMISDFTDSGTGFTFGCDAGAMLNFALQATDILFCPEDYPSGTQIYWRTRNNGVQALTLDQFKGVCKSLRQHIKNNMQKIWTLQSQVNQATTIDQVKAIHW